MSTYSVEAVQRSGGDAAGRSAEVTAGSLHGTGHFPKGLFLSGRNRRLAAEPTKAVEADGCE